jgi:TRAP transporter TAXI family solute receptor
MKWGFLAATVVTCHACVAPDSGSSAAKPSTPAMMVIAVGQPGSVLNAVGTGVAKLVTEKTAIRMRVRVTSGMDALVGAGDAELGVTASDSAHLSSHGLRHYEGRPQKRLRLALPGPPLLLGFLVAADSEYRTIEDLRNARVPGEYPNTRPMYHDGNAILGTAGMSWKDLHVLPVASFRDGMQAFIEGRTDATISSVGSGLTQEADASLGGVRFLSLPRGVEVSERMWSQEPGFHAVAVASGYSVGVDEDMVLAAKEVYLTANADASADAIHDIVALLWDQMQQLSSVHPLFGRWTHDAMTNAKVTVPFHEGTVRFLQERGLWTPAHEETQERLLADLTG